jgi:hypothetical protein
MRKSVTSALSRDCGRTAVGVAWLRRTREVVCSAAVIMTTVAPCVGDESGDARSKPATKPTVQTFRLVNVTIPPDSPHRVERPASGQDQARPVPKLYIYVLKDGKHLETSSTYGTRGWSVDFPDEEANQWAIEQGSNARYGIQLWNDNGTFYDTQVVSITGIRGEDFHGTIFEAQQKGVGKDRCISFTFEAVEEPTPPPAATTEVETPDAKPSDAEAK